MVVEKEMRLVGRSFLYFGVNLMKIHRFHKGNNKFHLCSPGSWYRVGCLTVKDYSLPFLSLSREQLRGLIKLIGVPLKCQSILYGEKISANKIKRILDLLFRSLFPSPGTKQKKTTLGLVSRRVCLLLVLQIFAVHDDIWTHVGNASRSLQKQMLCESFCTTHQ